MRRIAVTQIRLSGRGRAYIERLVTTRDRRRISDEVYRRLGRDRSARSAFPAVAA